MEKLIKSLFSEHGKNSQRTILLLAVFFLYPKIEKFEQRLTRIEARLDVLTPRQAKTIHESTNVFSFVRPGVIDSLQINAD